MIDTNFSLGHHGPPFLLPLVALNKLNFVISPRPSCAKTKRMLIIRMRERERVEIARTHKESGFGEFDTHRIYTRQDGQKETK